MSERVEPTVPLDHEELVVRRGARSGADDGGRRPLDRARPRARRGAAVALRPRRGRRSPTRCGWPRDDLQGGRGRARPRRRQGRDLRPADGAATAEPGSRRRDAARLRRPRRVAGRPLHHRRGRRHRRRRHGRRSPSGPRTSSACRRGRRRRRRPEPVHRDGVEAAIRACVESRFGTARPARARGRRRSASATSARGWRSGWRAAGARARRLRHRSRQARARGASSARAGSSPTSAIDGRAATCSRRARSAARSTAATSSALRCEIVCGAANNQLADDALAERLRRARDPLRARLHRQRRRADQRLPRAPRLRRATGRSSWSMGIEQTMRAGARRRRRARGVTPLDGRRTSSRRRAARAAAVRD